MPHPITHTQLFINNKWCDSHSGDRLPTIDPSTEEIICEVACGNAQDIDDAVRAAQIAFAGPWTKTEPRESSHLLYQLSLAIRADADQLATLETLDTGKPLSHAKGEVLGAARYFEYYAGLADKVHGETIPIGNDYIDFTLIEPLGVTAHIVPWNAPLSMVARSVAPALATGNTAVVKPAEQTPLSALALGAMMQTVGFPAGVYNVVNGFGYEAGAALSSHAGIHSLTFTGSVPTGRQVMQAAAEQIKPVVLELGGKSPQLVFRDADLDHAVAEVAKGIYSNTGQYCDAGSRLVIDTAIKQPFLEKLVAYTKDLKIGEGMDDPDMGPLVSAEHLERVMDYVRKGTKAGAQLLTGGDRPAYLKRGYFLAPTIFDQVTVEMAIAQEEIFGPVLSVLSFEDEAEAVEIANNSVYGLGAGIFTRDIDRALRLTKKLQTGYVMINEYFAGDIGAPFGGYKQSGIGRERGLVALQNYTQTKNVTLRIRS
ncbi:MAG: aldehyde dehydrogenase family protein [Cyanobacteria bacterium P01_D01_bin.1]